MTCPKCSQKYFSFSSAVYHNNPGKEYLDDDELINITKGVTCHCLQIKELHKMISDESYIGCIYDTIFTRTREACDTRWTSYIFQLVFYGYKKNNKNKEHNEYMTLRFCKNHLMEFTTRIYKKFPEFFVEIDYSLL